LCPKDIILLQNLPNLEERLTGISLDDILNFYEKIKEYKFESLSSKYLILLDEVHNDENWELFLKNISDRTKGHKNILIIAAGSSAINLRMNPDLSRRVLVEDI
jgi:hypothetical protein